MGSQNVPNKADLPKICQFISPLYLMVDKFLVSNWLDWIHLRIRTWRVHWGHLAESFEMRHHQHCRDQQNRHRHLVSAAWRSRHFQEDHWNVQMRGNRDVEMRGYWLVNNFILVSFCKGHCPNRNTCLKVITSSRTYSLIAWQVLSCCMWRHEPNADHQTNQCIQLV